ncbi:aminotransferase class I/II-fold pyridoxal phosphate-dependent enzyme [Virgibacillus xinjiangensis]|uniref:Aminotransferase class I/II-fold pyridoxal phosphate-dependent enzyme n=1 Tax=Virgibacillus xinjiangensis TaxID=393090 RepID=A0ABV7CZV8_9BACI
MNKIAEKLNEIIEEKSQHTYEMLSDLGRSIFYPKGILSQSAEAKGKATSKFNATLGIATEEDQPMHFDHIQDTLPEYAPEDIYPYAPPQGKEALRKAWKEKLFRENPSLEGKKFGNPVATNALTHGLSIAGDLFVNPGDQIIVPDKFWGNYNLTFHVRRGGEFSKFTLFDEHGKFHVEAFRETVMEQKTSGKAIVVLNFPNNPTGYTPHQDEVDGIVSVLKEAAESGINLVVLLDDAYFGLFYEDSVKESIFGQLIGLHPRLLPVKIDGATKENYVWGLRVGFITFGAENAAVQDALEQKAKGLVRGTISSGSHLSQTVILKSLESDDFEKEKKEKYALMESRARKVKEVLAQDKYQHAWKVYPFNSGYFMCLELLHTDAEKLRVHLLDKYGVGTIAVNATDLRIAFSSVEEKDIEELFELIHQGVQDLSK